MPINPALEWPRQEDLKFKDSLEYTARACLKFKNKKKKGRKERKGLRHCSAFVGAIILTAHSLVPNFP